MRTIVRAFLFTALFGASLLFLQTSAWRIGPGLALSRLSLAMLGCVAVAAVVCNALVFVLAPAAMPVWRRLLHMLGATALGVTGYVVLESIDLAAAPTLATLADSEISAPVQVLVGFLFAGYLVVSAIFRPQPVGRAGLPRSLRSYLLANEQHLSAVRQTRWLHPITPDTLLATEQRLLVYRPTNLGLTSTIEDYNYIDIANIRLDCGWLFCTISMKERFDGHDMVFSHIPKRSARRFVRVVTEQLQQRQMNTFPIRPLFSDARAGTKPGAVARMAQR